MAGAAANILTESDYGNNDDSSTINEGLGAPLIRGDLTDLPPAAPTPRGPIHQRQQDNTPIQIIETDDNFQPLGGDYRESSLADDPTNGTLLERRALQEENQRQLSDRQMRRERQRQGRERTLTRNEELEREVADLKAQQQEFLQRFGHIEPRLLQIDRSRLQDQFQGLQQQIDATTAQANEVQRKFAEALTTGDAEAVGNLLAQRDALRDRGVSLISQKNQLEQQISAAPEFQQPQFTPLPPPMSPVRDRYVRDFVARNPWYNPKDPMNVDSQVMLQLDRAVAAEGYHPETQEYWDKLDDLASQYIPHRYAEPAQLAQPAPRRAAAPQQRQQPADPVRRGPQVGGGNDRAAVAPAAPGNNQFYLSPQRKQALMDLGALDRNGRVTDQARFERYARGYMKYDRENPGVES